MPAPGPMPARVPLPPAPPPTPGPLRRGLSGASVPKILLTLGAACLLVAALVFLAVTWTVLGVGGRTAIIVAATVTAGGFSVWLTQRSLRGGGEAFSVIAYGLLMLDVAGANSAGWLGNPDPSALVALGGAVLVLAAGVLARLTGSSTGGSLMTTQVAGAAGLSAMVGGTYAASDYQWGVLAVGAGVLFGVSYAALLGALPVLRILTGLTGLLAWVTLVGDAIVAVASDDLTWVKLFGGGGGLELVAAGAVAVGVAACPREPHLKSVVAASLAALVGTFALVLAFFDEGTFAFTVVCTVVGVAAAAVTVALSRRWVAVPVTVLGVFVPLAAAIPAALAAASVFGYFSFTEAWTRNWNSRLPASDVEASTAVLLLFVPLALGVALVIAASRSFDRIVGRLRRFRLVLALVEACSLLALAGLYRVPVAAFVAVGVLVSVVVLVTALARRRDVGALVVGLVHFGAACALAAAYPSQVLSLAALLLWTVLMGSFAFLAKDPVSRFCHLVLTVGFATTAAHVFSLTVPSVPSGVLLGVLAAIAAACAALRRSAAWPVLLAGTSTLFLTAALVVPNADEFVLFTIGLVLLAGLISSGLVHTDETGRLLGITGVVGVGLAALAPFADDVAAAWTNLLSEPWWSESVGARLSDIDTVRNPLFLVVAVVAIGIALAAGRVSLDGPIPVARAHGWPATAVVGITAFTSAATFALPRALFVGVAIGAVAVTLAVARGRSGQIDASTSWIAGGFLLVAVVIGGPSKVLFMLAAAVWVLVAVAGAIRGVDLRTRTTWLVSASPALTLAAATAASVTGLSTAWWAAPVLGCAVVAVAVMARRGVPVLAIEVPAMVCASVVSAISVAAAQDTSVTAAAYLVGLGGLISGHAIAQPSRRRISWAGGILLLAATWLRLNDYGVTTVEAYTAPAAAALIAVGVFRLRKDPDADTRLALVPGLALSTVPSLLVALGDPVSWRAALLGSWCLILILAGVGLRWSAPLVVGAVVSAVLVLREAGPYVSAGPQWLPLAVAGVLLTLVGVTWEKRMAELAVATRYLARLR